MKNSKCQNCLKFGCDRVVCSGYAPDHGTKEEIMSQIMEELLEGIRTGKIKTVEW